jgi:hypothetical protein
MSLESKPMPNGGTQGVLQHILKYHTHLNVRIRVLKVLSGADKNPSDFMTLLNHPPPLTKEQRPTILDALNRTVARTLVIVTDTHKHIDRVLYSYMTSYLPQAYRLSILIDNQDLFINSWLIRLSVDNVLLINTRRLSILCVCVCTHTHTNLNFYFLKF